MGQVDLNAFATTGTNTAATTPNLVESQQPAGTGSVRQVFTLGDPLTRANLQKITAAGEALVTQLDTASTSTSLSATDALAPAPSGNGVLINTAPTAGSFVAALVAGGAAQCDIQILGTATGTYYFEASMDSTTGSDGNWIATNYRQTGITNTVLGYSTVSGGVYRGAPSGFKYIRVRNVGGTTPTNALIFRFSNGSGTTFLNASIPAGTNPIGKIAIDQTTNVVAGTVMQTAAVAVGNGTNLNVQGYVSAIISVTGTMGANTAIAFEASVDDTTFVPITGHQIGLSGNLSPTTTNIGDFRFSCAAYKSIRARISVFGTGSVNAKGYVSAIPGHPTTMNTNLIAAVPTGDNTVGRVKITDGTNVLPVLTDGGGNYVRVGLTVNGVGLQQVNNGSDGQGTANSLAAINYGYVYNGTAWDRVRSTTTGVAAVNLNDGTNTPHILKSDGTAAGQNSQLVSGTGYTTATLTLNLATPNTAWFDMLNYSEMSFEILTNTGPATLTPQMSGDASQTNITIATMQQVGQTQSVGSANSTNATYRVTRGGRYFRLSSNATGAQTVTVVFTFYSLAAGTLNNGSAQSGSWNVGITDGTNQANVMSSTGTVAGNNSQLVAPAVQTINFTTSTVGASTLLANTDVSHYSSIEIVYTSVGVGLALTGQFSPTTGGAYLSQGSFSSSTLSSNTNALGVAAGVIYTSPIRGNFFQLAISALTSGTLTGTITLRTITPVFNATTLINGSVNSNSVVGSAVPANAHYMGMVAAGNLIGLQSVATVGPTAAGASGPLAVANYIYNGTNYDIPRTATTSAGTTGVGLLGDGILGFDGTNYQRISTDTTGLLKSNTTQIAGSAVALGNGTQASGTQRVTLASDSTGQVTLAAKTTGGATPYTLISAATTNATNVKNIPATVFGIQVSNTGAAVAFLKLFNSVAAPTVGTSVAVKTLIIPAGGGIVLPSNDIGINFNAGLSFSITGLAATADTTAVALAQVVVNIDYV